MQYLPFKSLSLSLILTTPFISPLAHSAAFGIAEQSALGIGNAFAGGAASAEDASTIWFNPAGMTRIKGNQLVLGTHFIAPSFDFNDEGSSTGLGAPITADTSNDGGRFAIVPNFYYVHSLNNELKVGLGINSPLGMATKYNNDWSGKYQAIESEIVTVNVNPSIAWKATTDLSLGFGISIQYIEATLNNKIDFTTICYSTSYTASTCGGVPGSATNDGFAQLEGDDISFGFNIGALYQLSEKTRIGLAYRSEVQHELEGDADFTIPSTVTNDMTVIPAGPAAGAPVGPVLAGVFADTNINTQPDLPASASLSIHHQWNHRVAVMADATWVGWSSVPELVIDFDNPSKTPSIEELKLKDNIRLSIGATYTTDGPWTYRTGFAYDEGAATDQHSRSPRFPDNDRYWLTFGASYQLSEDLSIDTGYAHLFVPDTKIDRVGVTGETLSGTYESDADIFSAQLRWNM